ncbi:hypothetical protein BGLT_02216 [Caballeronia glathei]|nr:hypothetical protein [Caballeronia glathei]CDY79435.1 hypothetical protein BGLT_02216 [Caballeronia glathei]
MGFEKNALDYWVEITQGWLTEQQRKQNEVDETAYERFLAKLFEPIEGLK